MRSRFSRRVLQGNKKPSAGAQGDGRIRIMGVCAYSMMMLSVVYVISTSSLACCAPHCQLATRGRAGSPLRPSGSRIGATSIGARDSLRA